MLTPKSGLQLAKSALSAFLAAGIALSSLPAQAQIAQAPLLVGGGSVPGNLALVPSVEYPTVISLANLGDYTHTSTYVGYFDAEKCYTYVAEAFTHPFFGAIAANQGGGYFSPKRVGRTCNGNDEWSGNFLNWATTQTIDPFRKALTGGYRSVDTSSKTILEKATRQNRSNYFDPREVTTGLSNLVPFTGLSKIEVALTQGSTDYMKNKTVRLRRWNSANQVQTAQYYSVRVEVCKAGLLEPNCKQYGSNWKPEGLLQRYADRIRYSAFSYLNQDTHRDGGVLRAQQGYIGPMMRTVGQSGEQTNPYAEWDPTTGIMASNPYNAAEGNSGVMNYLNKFGELSNRHKSYDPVSELYYTAIRYFKNQGNVASYSNSLTNENKDGFPVITSWADPIIYACQKNVILGIGDVYTHEDRNLPATGDNLDVAGWTQSVFDLEGINKTATSVFEGRGNSAYIAGLAYYANTTDLRDAIAGKQTVSTHWVDVRENRKLEPKTNNQYWLAAKYGGFKVPAPYQRGDALEEPWWRTNTDTLSLGVDGNLGTEKRPDNFYVASDAENMVRSLELAFAQIASEMESSLNTLASNSTRLDTDTAVFQSTLNSRHWSGDLLAKPVDSAGRVSDTPAWSAAARLEAANASTRNIFTATPLTVNGSDGSLSSSAVDFTWSSLAEAQRSALMTAAEITASDDSVAQNRLLYLRGDRSLERSDTNQSRPFRQRGGRLGDIANSDPQYVGKQNFGYGLLGGTAWASARAAYPAFLTSKESRTEMVVFGANDGMLHGVNADISEGGNGGDELFAFIPSSVFANLRSLTEPNYAHRYFVDGAPRVADAWIGSAWKTLVVGTTGAGGNSVFAIDATDPSAISRNSFLWEFSHPEMGYTIFQPALVALPSGRFAVVATSGYHDQATTSGKVWFLDASDGSILYSVDIPTTGSLGTPLLADINGDGVSDRLFVGDTLGNLWRMDIGADGVDNPEEPMFIALDRTGNRQPITSVPVGQTDDKGRHMVFFGTGSFMRAGDNEIPNNPQLQTFYGVLDDGTTVSRSQLLEQQILMEKVTNAYQARAVTDNALTTQKGWYLDLGWVHGVGATGARGERMVSKASFSGDAVIFTTMRPSSDPCASGGTSWIMALNYSSGSRLNYHYFDTNLDNSHDEFDSMIIGDEKIPVSGIQDPLEGVVKGISRMRSWLCYVSSGGAPKCIPAPDSQRAGRQSWQEER